MYKIAICIPTYKRPLFLRKLILSIVDCNLNSSLIRDIKILIVDNDSDSSAKDTVGELKVKFIKVMEIMYYNYPVKGLSNVRNELFRRAFLLNPDFLVLIDDDEYVTKEWLNALVGTIINSKADAVRGPVLAIAEEAFPDNIWCWFKRENYPDGTQISSFTTGNLILRGSVLKEYNIWFDDRFNSTGSEDSFFGIQMFKKGATIYWASGAIAYETIPRSRANIKWLMKRNYNGAITYTYILKLEKKYTQLLKKIVMSFIYTIVGFFSVPVIFFPVKKKYWSLLILSEGAGGIAGLFNIKYHEYK